MGHSLTLIPLLLCFELFFLLYSFSNGMFLWNSFLLFCIIFYFVYGNKYSIFMIETFLSVRVLTSQTSKNTVKSILIRLIDVPFSYCKLNFVSIRIHFNKNLHRTTFYMPFIILEPEISNHYFRKVNFSNNDYMSNYRPVKASILNLEWWNQNLVTLRLRLQRFFLFLFHLYMHQLFTRKRVYRPCCIILR